MDELRLAAEEYQKAVSQQDAAEVASWWVEDAVVLGAGLHIEGRAAFQKMLEGFYPSLTVHQMDVLEQDIAVTGDLGVETTRYHEVLSIGGGPQQTINGSYMARWHRDSDGQWKIKSMVLVSAGVDSLHSQ